MKKFRSKRQNGLRGPLLPHSAPSYKSAKQRFEKLIDLAISDFQIRLGTEFDQIEIAIEEIPNLRDLALAELSVPLGRVEKGLTTTVVLYRKPIELRSHDLIKMDRLIRDSLAELIGLALTLRPIDIDPNYDGRNY